MPPISPPPPSDHAAAQHGHPPATPTAALAPLQAVPTGRAAPPALVAPAPGGRDRGCIARTPRQRANVYPPDSAPISISADHHHAHRLAEDQLGQRPLRTTAEGLVRFRGVDLSQAYPRLPLMRVQDGQRIAIRNADDPTRDLRGRGSVHQQRHHEQRRSGVRKDAVSDVAHRNAFPACSLNRVATAIS